MIAEIKAIYRNDPAARGIEPLLYPGLYAVVQHKMMNHVLYRLRFRFLARLLSQFTRLLTGIEIHPGARIGKGLFIDHGMGIVIGETAEIGDNCVLFHGVTLGGTGHHSDKRHPTIKHNVLIGANATILGPTVIGENCRVGAETVIINSAVPPDCTVVGAPGRIVRRDGLRVDEVPDRLSQRDPV